MGLTVVIAATLLFAQVASAQQSAPTDDSTHRHAQGKMGPPRTEPKDFGFGVPRAKSFAGSADLERPRPVCRFHGSDVQAAITTLATILRRQGVTLIKLDETDGELRGSLEIGKGAEIRILLWIERELAQPTEGFKCYMIAAQYMKLWGYSDSVSVEMSEPVRRRMILLSSALMEASSQEKR